MIRRLLAVGLAALALAGAAPLAAQKGPPKRPPLAAGADTNLAHAYYDRGLEVLEQLPSTAADAFYWAARLDPMWADAYYAHRVALLLVDSRRVGRYMRRDRSTLRSATGLRADSLQLRALALNPFLYQKLDRYLLSAVVRELAAEVSGGSSADAVMLEFEVERYLKESVEMRAWYAYSYGQFPQALEHYAAAIARTREKARLRAQRGRLFFQLGQADSALAEVLEAQRRTADALAEYRRFLALASRQDARVADVNDRVVALASTSAAP